MEIYRRLFNTRGILAIGAIITALLFVIPIILPKPLRAENERIVTIYHDGLEKTVVTDAPNVGEVLKRVGVALNEHDAVEPAAKTELTAPSYSVNVYRARPVVVVDGAQRFTVMSPHTSARKIAESAGLKVYNEDIFALTRINDFLHEDGVGLKLTIDRSTPITLALYGKKVDIRTQAETVGDLLKEKNVTLGPADGMNGNPDAPITAGMSVEVWRNGVQTITQEEDIAFAIEQIRDADKPVGFKEVRDPGEPGKKVVTYEVELRNGQEVSRKEIQSMIAKEPKKQIEVVGAKSSGGLTKAKGVFHFVDSKGIDHRETYYDLPMNVVMRNCGGDGTYNVREDGAKIDRDGYILVAANLHNYPRCSVVETSLGLGKVYDTGGFATRHPHGFDLATDWTNYDKR